MSDTIHDRFSFDNSEGLKYTSANLKKKENKTSKNIMKMALTK